jgi:hypothetical protein
MGIEKDELNDEERDKQRAMLCGEYYRLDFIRRAAIAYASTLEQIDGDLSEPKVLALIWSDARALWNAKPEDC